MFFSSCKNKASLLQKCKSKINGYRVYPHMYTHTHIYMCNVCTLQNNAICKRIIHKCLHGLDKKLLSPYTREMKWEEGLHTCSSHLTTIPWSHFGTQCSGLRKIQRKARMDRYLHSNCKRRRARIISFELVLSIRQFGSRSRFQIIKDYRTL